MANQGLASPPPDTGAAFSRFGQLPPEIRHAIWDQAVAAESDSRVVHVVGMKYRFRPTLDLISPLTLTNREARDRARKYYTCVLVVEGHLGRWIGVVRLKLRRDTFLVDFSRELRHVDSQLRFPPSGEDPIRPIYFTPHQAAKIRNIVVRREHAFDRRGAVPRPLTGLVEYPGATMLFETPQACPMCDACRRWWRRWMRRESRDPWDVLTDKLLAARGQCSRGPEVWRIFLKVTEMLYDADML